MKHKPSEEEPVVDTNADELFAKAQRERRAELERKRVQHWCRRAARDTWRRWFAKKGLPS